MFLGREDFLKEFCQEHGFSLLCTIYGEKMIVKKKHKSLIHYGLFGFNGNYLFKQYKTKKET
jgi:hypothetical protein